MRPERPRRWLAAWMLTWALAACGAPASDEAALTVTRTDSAGVEIVSITGAVESLPAWQLSGEPIAVVSGEAEPFLTNVAEVEILADGRFYVADNASDELYLFASDASTWRVSGTAGDGPGEFRMLTHLNLGRGDTAFAFDLQLRRLTVLDPDGTFLSSRQIDRDEAGPGTVSLGAWGLDSDRLLVISEIPTDTLETRLPRRQHVDALLYELDGSGAHGSGPVRFTGSYTVRGERFEGGSSFANWPFVSVAAPDRLLRGSAIEYELRLESRAFVPVRTVRWSGWRRALDDSVVARVRDTLYVGFADLRERNPELASELMEGLFAAEILPDSLPALRAAQLDDRGRIWVSRFRPTTDRWNQVDAWHVLAPDGTPLARLSLPPNAQLEAVRGDLVAIVVRDEVDLQHVRIHRLIEETER